MRDINAREWERRLASGRKLYRLKHRYRIALDRILAHGPSTWLDVGAGNGFLGKVVKDHYRGSIHVTGIDFAANALQEAQAYDETHTHDLDADALPFEDNRFDYITCLEVIEHLVLPHKALHEIHRVLKPGGRVLVSVPNLQFIEYLLALARGKMPHPAADPRHMSIYTLGFLRRRLREAGLVPVHAAGCDGSPPFLARVSKRFLAKTIVVEAVKPA